MKQFRAIYGLSEAQKKEYYVSWMGRKSVTVRAPSAEQAEFLARFQEAPTVSVSSKTKMVEYHEHDNTYEGSEKVKVQLVLLHLYEVTKPRKIF